MVSISPAKLSLHGPPPTLLNFKKKMYSGLGRNLQVFVCTKDGKLTVFSIDI